MTMTKKSSQSFWHWERDMRISSWFNISPSSFTSRYRSCRWASRSTSSWFCFGLWSARTSKYIRLQRKFFRLHLRGFLFVVVVLFDAQVRDQLIQSMRNSDPRVKIVFVYRFNSNFSFIFTLLVAGCDFHNGPTFGIPSIPTFRVRWFFISWQGVLTTCHWFCELWELFSVLCHKYCPTSTVVKNPQSVQILITRFCCESLSTRSLYFCNKSSCEGTSVGGVGVVLNKHAGSNNGSDWSASTSLSVLAWQILYSSHTSETAP